MNDEQHYQGPERRYNRTRFSAEEIDEISDAVIEKMASNAGRTGLRAIVWFIGISITILLGWLSTKIHFRLDQ